jgi:hypothetical protein
MQDRSSFSFSSGVANRSPASQVHSRQEINGRPASIVVGWSVRFLMFAAPNICVAPFLRCRRQLLIRFDLIPADSMTCRLIQSAEIRLGRPSVSSLHLRRLRLPEQRFNLHERPN